MLNRAELNEEVDDAASDDVDADEAAAAADNDADEDAAEAAPREEVLYHELTAAAAGCQLAEYVVVVLSLAKRRRCRVSDSPRSLSVRSALKELHK